MKYFTFIFLAITLGCASPKHNQGEATQQFFKLDTKLQDVDLGYYLDGGTTSLELTDVHGNKSLFCIDDESFGQLIPIEEKDHPDTEEFINRLKEKCIYMGVRHPSHEGGEKIEYRSQLEYDILKKISDFIEKNPQFEKDLSRFVATTQSKRDLSVEYYNDLETHLKK